MNYYARHIGDYLKDTCHLSLLEHGIYCRLMDVYYSREGGLPQTDVARFIGVRSKDERAALDVVLQDFFVLQDGIYTHARCEREIARYQQKALRNRTVGKLGGRPPAAHAQPAEPRNNPDGYFSEPTENPNQYPIANNQEPITNSQEPTTNSQQPNTNSQTSPQAYSTSAFEQFWQAYPLKNAKPAALRAFNAAQLDAPMLADVLRDIARRKEEPEWQKAGGQFIPNPANYLAQRRWQDVPAPVALRPSILPGAI